MAYMAGQPKDWADPWQLDFDQFNARGLELTEMLYLHIPAQREHSIRNVNTESGETAKVFTLKPDSVFTFGRNGCSRSPEYAFCRCRGDSDRGLDAWVQ